MKHPETANLARAAYEASGAKTHTDFLAMLKGAVPLRTFRRWLAGDNPADALAQLVLREVRDGWRPSAQ